MSTISKLSSVRVKLLVGQVVRRLVDGEMDYAKIARLAEGGVAEGDVRAAVAALHLIVTGGAKHDVEETILAKELEQLGLPKEHSDAVCRPYGKDKERLRAALVDAVVRVDNLVSSRWELCVTGPEMETTQERGSDGESRVNVGESRVNVGESRVNVGESRVNVGERAGSRVEADENLAGVAVRVALEWELARRGAVEFVADESRIASLLHQLRAAREALDR